MRLCRVDFECVLCVFVIFFLYVCSFMKWIFFWHLLLLFWMKEELYMCYRIFEHSAFVDEIVHGFKHPPFRFNDRVKSMLFSVSFFFYVFFFFSLSINRLFPNDSQHINPINRIKQIWWFAWHERFWNGYSFFLHVYLCVWVCQH